MWHPLKTCNQGQISALCNICIFTGRQIYEGEKLYVLAGRNKMWLIAAARNLCKIDRDLRTFVYNIQESTCQDWESRICQIILILWQRNDNCVKWRIDYHDCNPPHVTEKDAITITRTLSFLSFHYFYENYITIYYYMVWLVYLLGAVASGSCIYWN